MRWLALGHVLAIFFIAPATAEAVPSLQVTEHVLPVSARTGEVVQARVTVTNVGNTPTQESSEISWEATNEEGFINTAFAMRAPVCPLGSAPPGPGPGNSCQVSSPIEPGATLTAAFSGSSRTPLVLEARARVVTGDTGLSDVDTTPFTINGPALPEPPGPRVSGLTIEDRSLTPGARATLRFKLDRAAKFLHASLFKCRGKRRCRRVDLVGFSTITTRGRSGANTLRYRLPAGLAPGRYRITVWAYEAFHRQLPRSVSLRVLPRRH
jgi:hypothetical protein